jgi:hypothetical protein
MDKKAISSLFFSYLLFSGTIFASDSEYPRLVNPGYKNDYHHIYLNSLTGFNFNEGYQYVVHVNGEPVNCGSGLSAFDWSGYPLKSGSNELKFTVVTWLDPAKISCDISHSAGSQPRTIEIKQMLEATNKLEETFSFELNNPTQAKFGFEKFSTGLEALTNQLITASMNFCKVFSERDAAGLGKLLGVEKTKILSGYPEWFFSGASTIKTTTVKNGADVEVLVGAHLAMVKPSWQFAQKHPNAGIVSVRNTEKDEQILKDCLIFCQISNELCVFASDSNPMPVKLDSKH